MASQDYLDWLSSVLFPKKDPTKQDHTLGSRGEFIHGPRTEITPGSFGPMSARSAARLGGQSPYASTPAEFTPPPTVSQRGGEYNDQYDAQYDPATGPNNSSMAQRGAPMPPQQAAVNNGANAQRYRPMPPPAAAAVAPLPPRRPVDLPPVAANGQYQSNNMQVQTAQGGPVNWGDEMSAADFFRADKAYRGLLG